MSPVYRFLADGKDAYIDIWTIPEIYGSTLKIGKIKKADGTCYDTLFMNNLFNFQLTDSAQIDD